MTIRYLHGQRGQALVEFALVAFAFFALFFGILDFGRALFAYDFVGNAARMGARWAMVRGSGCSTGGCPATSSSVTSYLQSKSAGLDTSQLSAVVGWSNTTTCLTGNGAGCLVTVTVTYTYHFVYRLPAITMTSASTMVVSQ